MSERKASEVREIIALLDTETTGLKPHDRVCEIGIALLDLRTGVYLSDPYARLVNPGMPMPAETVAIHGITDAMLCDAPTLADIWPRVLAHVKGYDVIAHNADFDRRLLRQSLRAHGVAEPPWRWYCSKSIAQRVLPGQPSYRLQDLTASLALSRGDAHRAKGDVETLSALMLHMRRKTEKPWQEWREPFDVLPGTDSNTTDTPGTNGATT